MKIFTKFGFSLVELMVVLPIISIVVGFVLPKFKNLRLNAFRMNGIQMTRHAQQIIGPYITEYGLVEDTKCSETRSVRAGFGGNVCVIIDASLIDSAMIQKWEISVRHIKLILICVHFNLIQLAN